MSDETSNQCKDVDYTMKCSVCGKEINYEPHGTLFIGFNKPEDSFFDTKVINHGMIYCEKCFKPFIDTVYLNTYTSGITLEKYKDIIDRIEAD